MTNNDNDGKNIDDIEVKMYLQIQHIFGMRMRLITLLKECGVCKVHTCCGRDLKIHHIFGMRMRLIALLKECGVCKVHTCCGREYTQKETKKSLISSNFYDKVFII